VERNCGLGLFALQCGTARSIIWAVEIKSNRVCAPRSTSDSISASHRSTSRTKNLRLRTYKRIAGITNEDEREESTAN